MPSPAKAIALAALPTGLLLPALGAFSVWAQTPAPVFPLETLTPIVTQVSDSLGKQISSSSCQDLSALLTKVQAAGNAPADTTSIVGQVLQSVKTNEQLKGIVVNRVGPPLINKLLQCNMIPAELINISGTAPAAKQ